MCSRSFLGLGVGVLVSIKPDQSLDKRTNLQGGDYSTLTGYCFMKQRRKPWLK